MYQQRAPENSKTI